MLPAKTKDKCHTKQWCVHSVTTALRFAKGLALQFFFFFLLLVLHVLPPVSLFPRKAQLFLKSHLLPASLVIPTSNFDQLNLIKFASFNDDPVWAGGVLNKNGAPRRCRDVIALILILDEIQYFWVFCILI